jgi:hypothetical protein
MICLLLIARSLSKSTKDELDAIVVVTSEIDTVQPERGTSRDIFPVYSSFSVVAKQTTDGTDSTDNFKY